MNIKTFLSKITPLAEQEGAVGFTIERLQIGRAHLHGIQVNDRPGAINFIEILTTLLERTMRRRAGNHAMFPVDLPFPAPTQLLSQELRLYFEQCKRRRLSSSYLTGLQQAARILLAACDDLPVSQITHDHIVAFWDAMRCWPSKRSLLRQFRGLSDQQILAESKLAPGPPPADSTIALRMQMISTFFAHLKTKRAIVHSPCQAIKTHTGSLKRATVRRPFTHDELVAIFSPESFVPWATLPHLWWMPMIGLFTGARVNEIAQLKTSDIECLYGIWCIHIRITTDDDRLSKGGFSSRQQLKSSHAKRLIPIAQPLLDAGFLDFVDDMKQLPHPRLFPHLCHRLDPTTQAPDGNGYSLLFRRRFTRYLRQFVPHRYLAFHAFRHTFSSALQRHGVPLPLIGKMTGHRPTLEVPNLEKFYLEDEPESSTLKKMSDALRLLNPPVVLPRYTKGQFAKTLRGRWEIHP